MRINIRRKLKDEGRSLRRRARLEGLDFSRDYPKDGIGGGALQCFPGSEYDAEEVGLIKAMDAYVRDTGRKFPQFTEVLAVLRSIGWRRVAESVPLPKFPIVKEEGDG